MKGFVPAILALMGLTAFISTAQAHDHVYVGIGVGGGYYHNCCGYYPYYSPYYSYYPYYAPPPVVYATPPAVVYQDVVPAPTPYVQPQVQAQEEPQALPSQQTSPTFKDKKGRTCRTFQSTLEDGTPVSGKACLRPDGTWRTVE